jgi:hypothetical protein
MRDKENLDKTIYFDQKSTNKYSLQLSGHRSIKWPTGAPPYIPDSFTHPLPGICPGQRFTILLED